MNRYFNFSNLKLIIVTIIVNIMPRNRIHDKRLTIFDIFLFCITLGKIFNNDSQSDANIFENKVKGWLLQRFITRGESAAFKKLPGREMGQYGRRGRKQQLVSIMSYILKHRGFWGRGRR